LEITLEIITLEIITLEILTLEIITLEIITLEITLEIKQLFVINTYKMRVGKSKIIKMGILFHRLGICKEVVVRVIMSQWHRGVVRTKIILMRKNAINQNTLIYLNDILKPVFKIQYLNSPERQPQNK